MLAYMSLHESCLLACCPYFNTMKLWTFDPNLCLSLADTNFCLLSCLFAFSLICSHPCFYACHVYHVYLLYAPFICSLHLFLPLLVCWFLVFTFACKHMDRGRMELGHNLSGANKESAGTSILTWIKQQQSIGLGVWPFPLVMYSFKPLPSSSLSLIDGLY